LTLALSLYKLARDCIGKVDERRGGGCVVVQRFHAHERLAENDDDASTERSGETGVLGVQGADAAKCPRFLRRRVRAEGMRGEMAARGPEVKFGTMQ